MPPLAIESPHLLKEFVGRELGQSDWFRVTQDRIQQFAEATEDRQWIHTDPERAKRESPYGTTIAHGFLTLSLLSHLLREVLQIRMGVPMAVNYGLNRVRFPAPVRSGSKVRARITLVSFRELTGAVEAVFGASIESEETPKPCCVAEWIVHFYTG
jgi:acyl dehydratase